MSTLKRGFGFLEASKCPGVFLVVCLFLAPSVWGAPNIRLVCQVKDVVNGLGLDHGNREDHFGYKEVKLVENPIVSSDFIVGPTTFADSTGKFPSISISGNIRKEGILNLIVENLSDHNGTEVNALSQAQVGGFDRESGKLVLPTRISTRIFSANSEQNIECSVENNSLLRQSQSSN